MLTTREKEILKAAFDYLGYSECDTDDKELTDGCLDYLESDF